MKNKNKQRRERFVLQEINEAAEIVIKGGGKPPLSFRAATSEL